jgi:hypothetical protein
VVSFTFWPIYLLGKSLERMKGKKGNRETNIRKRNKKRRRKERLRKSKERKKERKKI